MRALLLSRRVLSIETYYLGCHPALSVLTSVIASTGCDDKAEENNLKYLLIPVPTCNSINDMGIGFFGGMLMEPPLVNVALKSVRCCSILPNHLLSPWLVRQAKWPLHECIMGQEPEPCRRRWCSVVLNCSAWIPQALFWGFGTRNITNIHDFVDFCVVPIALELLPYDILKKSCEKNKSWAWKHHHLDFSTRSRRLESHLVGILRICRHICKERTDRVLRGVMCMSLPALIKMIELFSGRCPQWNILIFPLDFLWTTMHDLKLWFFSLLP